MKKRLIISVMSTICFAGCSAQYWGGDTAGKRPGVVFKHGFFSGTTVEMTSDGTGEVGELTITKSKDGYGLTIGGLKLNQTPSIDIKAEAEKLAAIAELQRVQVAYMKEVMIGLTDISRALMPAIASWQQLIGWFAGQAIVEHYRPVTTQPVTQSTQ